MNDNTGSAFKGRVEDIRFVSGHGQFTADIVPENAPVSYTHLTLPTKA